MHTFPLLEDGRSVPSAPGARRAALSVADVSELVRSVLAHLERVGLTAALAPLDVAPEPDDDPDLGPLLGLLGPRVYLTEGVAFLPPSLRFNCEREDGVYRLFAVGGYDHGINGYALAPSELRPGMSVFAFAEFDAAAPNELGPVTNWLHQALAPLAGATPDPAAGPGLAAHLAEQAGKLWRGTAAEIPAPAPRPDWAPPAGRREGTWTLSRHGVVMREENYHQGHRDGPVTWWHVTEELAAEEDLDDDVFTHRQGPIEREGTFRRGAAHGTFRFYDEHGRLLQALTYLDPGGDFKGASRLQHARFATRFAGHQPR